MLVEYRGYINANIWHLHSSSRLILSLEMYIFTTLEFTTPYFNFHESPMVLTWTIGA